ncbi:MAG TPA: pseudouridine synthase [Candidatus Pacebacteria bacterium]|nr:pseudouridine synthase [Candidatus Paceibacterota bacterium]
MILVSSPQPIKTGAKERINKYLARLGIAARRKIDTLITEGRVMVNGQPATLGQPVIPGQDKILVNGKLVVMTPANVVLQYFGLYKPAGVISTVSDPDGRPTVMKYFKGLKTRLYPVGRLDQESEGLILMTNDGELAERLAHPRFHLPKIYLVWVSGEVTPQKLDHLRRGVRLKDGMTAPCEIEATPLENRRWSLLMTLREGKNRQIRRMLPHVELEVLKLKRIQFGPIGLGALKPGEWHKLSQSELELLKTQAGV